MTPRVQITYRNQSQRYQTLMILDSRCHLERTLAPKQEIVFEAFIDAAVEIFSGEFVTALLMERTLVSRLQNPECDL